MPTTTQSYQAFLQQNLTDRNKQKAYLDQVRETDTRFKGLDEGQSANILADVSGFEPFRRFAQGGVAQGLDAFGNFMTNAGSDFRPADIARAPQGIGQLITGGSEQTRSTPGMEKPVSLYTGDAAYAGAKAFGAPESTANAFRSGGEQIPNIAAQMGVMVGGSLLAPVTGGASLVAMPTVMASMYGQGLDQAFSQGEFGAKAHVAASVGPLVSMMTMGMARPLGNMAANAVMRVGMAEAIKDGMKLGGEVALHNVLSNAATTVGSRIAMRAAHELIVETAQAGIGVVGDLTQNAILDPQTFFNETIRSKDYWIPMLMSEVIEGAGGTIVGRLRNPLKLHDEHQVVAPDPNAPPAPGPTVPTTPGQGPAAGPVVPTPIAPVTPVVPTVIDPAAAAVAAEQQLEFPFYTAESKIEADVNPANANSDHQVVEAAQMDVQAASGIMSQTITDAKSSRVNPSFDPSMPEGPDNTRLIEPTESTYVRDKTHVVDTIARSTAAAGRAELHENSAAKASETVQAALSNAAAGVASHQAISNAMENAFHVAGKEFMDHRIETEPGNYIALRNPGTKEQGVLLHFVRDKSLMNKGSEEVGSKLILRPEDLLTLDPIKGRAALDERSKMAGLMTNGEWGVIAALSDRVKSQHAEIPFGVSFGEGHSQEYQAKMSEFLQRSGIQEALILKGRKLRFGIEAAKISKDTLLTSPLDYFAAMDGTSKARNNSFADMDYISRNRGFSNETDLHEIGHTVGDLLREGGFGDEAAAQWTEFMSRASSFKDDGTIGREGAELGLKISGEKYASGKVDWLREYYLKSAEIEAQIFQGYMLDKRNPFTAWVEKTFPTLHGLFQKIMKLLNVNENAALTEEKLNLYSPLYQEGRQLIAGILNANYRASENVATNLKKLVARHDIKGKAVDSVTSAWYSNTTPAAHAELSSAVKTWKDGLFDKDVPTEGEFIDLADSIAQLVSYNRSNSRGYMPAGEAIWGMPWLRKLAGGNLDKIYTAIRGKMVDPTLLNKLNEVFLTSQELDYIRTHKDNLADPKAMARASTLARNRELLQLNAQHMTAAIDELLAVQGENRVSGAQVIKQMFQVDAVVKNWMLGKLEGQNGVPFYDNNNKLFASGIRPDDVTAKSHTFARWFPLLSKEIRKSVTKSKLVQMTSVSDDGSIVFGREGTNKKRKVFDNEVDANDYRDGLTQQAINSEYGFKIKPETNKKTGLTKFYITAELVSKDTRYVEEMADMDGWEADMRELIKTPQTTTDIDYMTPAEIAIKSEVDAENARKIAFVRDNGPEVMRTLSDSIPAAIKYYSENGLLNDAMTAKEQKFKLWLGSNSKNRMYLDRLAEHLGLKANAPPIDVVSAWLKLHLDSGKSQQKADAILALNWLSPKLENGDSGMHDYIMSMTHFAKRYAKARNDKSMDTLRNPKSRNHVPDITPSELGGEARLTNMDPLNDENVTSGTAAAIVGIPGGFQGRNATVAQVTPNLKRIIGKPLGVIHTLHKLIGEGPIHISLTDVHATALGNFIYDEVGRASAWVHETFEYLFSEGDVNPTPGLVGRFVLKSRAKVDKLSSIYRIKSNPTRFIEHQSMLWLEQKSKMQFADLLNATDLKMTDEQGAVVDGTPLVEAAREIIKDISPEDLQLHQNGLERRYSAQKVRVQREAEMDNYNQIASFALGLITREELGKSAQKALAFAQRFHDLMIDDKVQSLVKELNMTPEEAMDVAEKYTVAENNLKAKHQYMFDHLEYITEARMKDYHVGVVFKASSDGTVPSPGYYDFDTVAEATQFIAEQKALGNKVPSLPKDFGRQRWNYKPISGSLHEIIERVTNARRDLVSTVLYKQIDQKTHDQIVDIMSNVAGDIMLENDVVLSGKNDMARRKFVKGRENLDMLSQFQKSTQRRAASLSRKRTDLLFKLYREDADLMSKPELFNTMDRFRESARLKDTDAQKKIGQAGFVAYIMGNISSALVEMFQFPLTLSPVLLENGASVMDAYRIPAKMMRLATKAALLRLAQKSTADIWEGPHADLLQAQEASGRSNQNKHHQLDSRGYQDMVDQYDSATDERGVKKSALHVGALVYKFMNDTYGFFNRINAELAVVSAYEVLKKTQYGNRALSPMETKELQNRAMLMSDVANGSLQRLGRPSFFNNKQPGIRNAASMYWSLQSFVNAQVANQLRFMQKWLNTDSQFTKAESVQARKAMVGLLGAQFTGMGIMGFTLMPAMAKIVQLSFGFDIEDELRDLLYDDTQKTASEKTFMGEVAINGLATAMGVPFDYGTRVSVGGLGPLNSFSGLDANQIGGPLIGLATSAFRDMQKIRAGNMDITEGAVNLLPMGLRRGVRMTFYDDGNIYDSNKRFMFPASGVEKAASWLGFTTLRAKQVMKSRMERDEATKQDSDRKSLLANQVIDAQKNNPSRVQQLLTDGANEFAMSKYDFAQHVAMKAVDKQKGPDPREGAGPESVRAKKLYPSPLGNQSREDRQLSIYSELQGMGVKPNVSRTALNNARQTDYMLRLDPTMTSGTAGRRLRDNSPRVREGFSQLLGE